MSKPHLVPTETLAGRWKAMAFEQRGDIFPIAGAYADTSGEAMRMAYNTLRDFQNARDRLERPQ